MPILNLALQNAALIIFMSVGWSKAEVIRRKLCSHSCTSTHALGHQNGRYIRENLVGRLSFLLSVQQAAIS